MEDETATPSWRAALRDAPDPDRALRLAETVVAAAPRDAFGPLAAERGEALARVLAALCGSAPFLAPYLVRHPAWLLELVRDDLMQPLERGALAAALDASLAAAPDAEAARVLRECKYRHLARITVRDCSDALVPLERSGETLAELSALADVLLERALRIARERVAARLGAPRWRDAAGVEVEAGFCVLGLGKLGGEELNYSSDVDLIYVHGAVADPLGGPQERAPAAYFTQIAQEFGALVAATTEDGFLYRIDLDLRPEGSRGLLVLSDEALATYHEAVADTWERVAFMKARPVAGDAELGWRLIRTVAPMLYQGVTDYAAVRRIRALKERVQRERGAAEGAFDVKLGAGGIRDVEFTAQALQLLHGARIPQIRDRGTQRALEKLAEVKLLPRSAADALLDAYRFLRRVENRLQMEAERQVHRVPTRPEALARLARSMGFRGERGVETFEAALEAERRRVIDFTDAFVSEDGAGAVLDLFARHEPQLFALPATRRMMETLAEHFGRAIAGSPDPELALANLDRFVEGLGGRRFYYELLLDRPELVPRLAGLFAGSRYLSSYLASHPRLIEPVFSSPETLLLSRSELRTDLDGIRSELRAAGEFERELAALRLFHHRQIVNIGLLDLAERVTREEAEEALSDVAEGCLERGLAIAREALGESQATSAGPGRFLVVGMGKLASRELGYGSDLDLVFFYDAGREDPDAQAHFVRLVQRLISVLQTRTGEGACYDIDARLRPSGNQGALVASLSGFRRYHERQAQVWERQALLRARPVAGDPSLGREYDDLRREVLRRPEAADLAAEIRRIRRRMETELAGETPVRRDLKTGRGGLLDVECAVQYLQLLHGRRHEELLDPDRIGRQLDRLEALGLLAPALARPLREGWNFLQKLGSRLRVVENRSISDLDVERGELDGLARRLGYRAESRESSARRALLRDYARHTEAIRAAYVAILGADA
jgi:[glutamine synthetase] adenylyltransferase / [glutamine synthetase]-adenylyl-L-tyrosine phosphorylase